MSEGAPPGWFADPFGRRQRRFWDGTAWADRVSDDGVEGIDPPGQDPTPLLSTGRSARAGRGRRRHTQMTAHQRTVLRTMRWLASGGFAVASIALIIISLHTRSLLQPVPGGVATSGHVVGVHAGAVRDGDVFTPVIAFTDRQGRQITFEAPTSSTEPTIGSSVRVSYDPHHPAGAHDLSGDPGSWEYQFFAGLAILIAFVLVGAVEIELFMRRRSPAHPARTMAASRGATI